MKLLPNNKVSQARNLLVNWASTESGRMTARHLFCWLS